MPIVHIGKRDGEGRVENILLYFSVTPSLFIVFPKNKEIIRKLDDIEIKRLVTKLLWHTLLSFRKSL